MVSSWIAMGMMAASAFAQKEQWLEYRINPQGYSYKYLDLSTNRPPGVAIPQCSAIPYFGKWKTPMDTNGRWFCLDRTRKSGPYNRIYVDTTGNGRLDDKTPIDSKRIDSYSANFDPIKLLFKGEDGQVAYHLQLRSMKYSDDQVRLLLRSAGSYSGTVDVGGRKVGLELLDENVNGCFNDQGEELGNRDCYAIKGEKLGQRYLGRMIELGTNFYRLEVSRDGAVVKVQKAENVVLGQVRVPQTISEINVIGDQGHFFRKPAKGEFSVPAGRYRVVDWKINRKDSKGASWTMEGSGFGKSTEFEVAAAQPATIAVGEPVRAILQPRESTGRVDFSIEFRGPQDERVSVEKGGQNPAPPKLLLTSADGVYRWTNSFEFG
jgi:hypothetical protein